MSNSQRELIALAAVAGLGLMQWGCNAESVPPDGLPDAAAAMFDASVGPPQIAFFSRPSPSDPWVPTMRSFWGDAIDVRLSSLPPGAAVTVGAQSGNYSSEAIFHAAADGTLDLATTAPDSGSYSGVDADGLFWSLTASDFSQPEAYSITLTAKVADQMVSATLNRYWAPKGAQLIPVSDSGLVGVFVTPPDPGPHPALITFGGSEGGIDTGQILAEYYASLGYACLGLAYFNAPGLPKELERIPLEYFAAALQWIEKRPEVDPTRIGVMGGSRGGELALLLGATYPDIKAVVATVPSGFVWGSANATGPIVAAWTLNGMDLPRVPDDLAAMGTTTIDENGNPVYAEAPYFLASIKAASPSALDAATIAVEKTNGPILMLAGADDQLWASCTLGKVAADRLTATGHSQKYSDDFQCYANTGHNVSEPDLPTIGADEAFIDGGWFALGGTPDGIAHAARESDTRIRNFLNKALMR